MKISEIYEKVRSFDCSDIVLLCAQNHIGIIPESVEEYENGSYAIILGNGVHKSIHIACLNKTSAEIDFIIRHEFGHSVTDPDENYKRNYLMSDMRKRYEQEANIFAVLSTLPKEPEGESTFLRAARKKGIPSDIAIMVRYLLSLEEDPFFKTYYDNYK